MKKPIVYIIFIGSLILAATHARAANWHVDPAAAGLNNGTSWENAWRSFADINWCRRWETSCADTKVKAGDTIYISGGALGTEKIYRETWVIGATGEPDRPITIALDGANNQHNGKVVFDFSHLGETANVNVLVVTSHNVIDGNVGGESHFEIRNLVNINTRGYANGFSGDTVQDITLRYLTFTNTNNPIRFSNSANVTVHHSHFQGVRGDAAIQIIESTEGWDVNRVYDNDIELLWNPDVGGPDGVQGGGSLSIYRNRFRVSRTSLYTSTQHVDDLQVPGNYLKIFNNEFINVGDSVISPGSWGDDERRHDIWVFNNIIRIEETLDPWPQYFRIYNNRGKILSYNNVKILNNTFVDNNIQSIYIGYGQLVEPTGSGNEIKNNIFYNVGGPYYFRSVWNIDPSSGYDENSWTTGNNIYFCSLGETYVTYLGTSYKASDWIRDFETTGSINPPIFVHYVENGSDNDFHLLPDDTTADDRGANLTSLCAEVPELCQDKDGHSRPSEGAWEVGAYEYTGPPTPSAPTIVSQPQDQTVQVGQTATFRVTVSGYPVPTYQWRKNGVDISEATRSFYTTPPVSLDDQGSIFVCVARNTLGTATSREAVLTVTPMGGQASTPTTYFLPFRNVFKPAKDPPLKISYQALSNEVTLEIYDRKGTKVADLPPGNAISSGYETEWNGRNKKGELVASGAYILQLKAGGEIVTKKLVVVK